MQVYELEHRVICKTYNTTSFHLSIRYNFTTAIFKGRTSTFVRKHIHRHEDNTPNALFLEDELNSQWPKSGARVICPIADPLVRHRGALGGFVRVHLISDAADAAAIVKYCQPLLQVECAYAGEEAATLFEIPSDREGDLVIVKKNAVIGSRRQENNLSRLQGFRLGSHGGLSGQEIPLVRSTPL